MKERRRLRRRRVLALFCVLLAVLLGAFIWLTWQSSVRISHIEVSNADSRILALVQSKITGTYLGIIPRNSFFFIPEHAIRIAIIEADPGIQAVSISRTSVTSLTILLHERVPIARWCGSTSSPQAALIPTDGEYCYLFDAVGFIYAASEVSTSTQALNSFALYAPLMNDTLEPLRATLAHAKQLPDLFDFARKVSEFGSPVVTIMLRDDEVDLFLESGLSRAESRGTRLTYVLGDEENAFSNLMSAKANLNLSDGSLLYVDLRFPGKVYLKRK
ncbi:MAG: hypothetical protein Q7R54_00620 [bacterium]|nr:hypothetical protein [bacterium]